MKLIIAGGRDFNDYSRLKEKLNKILSNTPKNRLEIISGNCDTGADALGERYAVEQGIRLILFPALWREYGRAAGPIRNEKMAYYATHCVCFWDGKSKGTKNMIDNAVKFNLHLRVLMY